MLRLAGGDITLVINAVDGGRITSLVAFEREWLAPSSLRGEVESFVDAGTGGWDEVAPTVRACVLPDGTALRDHGDAWRAPWRVLVNTSLELSMSVELTSLGVTLRRTIRATARGVRLEYEASTRSLMPVPLLWCAHPLFDASNGARIVAGGDLVQEYPAAGETMPWPTSLQSGSAMKAFASGLKGASVLHPDGAEIRMSWNLPYAGFYWDGGEFSDGPVIAIEPSTGASDFAARVNSALPTVTVDAPLRWWVALDV